MESRSKKNLYVGGLDPGTTEEILYAAFIPFGEISTVSIPKDYTEGRTRGFGFVDFQEPEDAAAALENMDGAELMGRVIRVTIAKPQLNLKANQPVWSVEEWWSKNLKDAEEELEPVAPLEPSTAPRS